MRYLTEDQKIFNTYLARVSNLPNKKSRISVLKENNFSISKEKAEIDPKLFEELDLRLSRARFYLQKEQPFYWRILNTLKTVMTFSVPTMAVDAVGNIYINPDFAVNTLDQDGVTAVLVHECGHVVGLTFFRKGDRNHRLWNVATDYIINRDLLEDGFKLPDYENFKALLPVRTSNNRWIIPQYDNVDITDWTAERMYQFLYNWKKEDPETVKEDEEVSEEFDTPLPLDGDPSDEDEGDEGDEDGEGQDEGDGEGDGDGDGEGDGDGDGEGDGDGDGEGDGDNNDIKVGDVIKTSDNKWGIVTSIDKSAGEVDFKPIPESDAHKYLK